MEQQMKIIADAVNEIMRQTLADRDEIERLREQVKFERDSLQSAFGEMRKQDGDIERLQKHIKLLGEEIYLLNSNQPGGDKPSENS